MQGRYVQELVKLKIQAKKEDIDEFQKRLVKKLEEIDCRIMDETPTLQNRNNSVIHRKYLFLSMKKRKRGF